MPRRSRAADAADDFYSDDENSGGVGSGAGAMPAAALKNTLVSKLMRGVVKASVLGSPNEPQPHPSLRRSA